MPILLRLKKFCEFLTIILMNSLYNVPSHQRNAPHKQKVQRTALCMVPYGLMSVQSIQPLMLFYDF